MITWAKTLGKSSLVVYTKTYRASEVRLHQSRLRRRFAVEKGEPDDRVLQERSPFINIPFRELTKM